MIGTQIGSYKIVAKLGEGGMGVVYKAVDVTLDRTVAIKSLSAELNKNPDLEKRFRAEAKAQANLNHTNIATLYAFLVQDGIAWMVMEYIEGETVHDMIQRRGPIPHQEAIPIFKQALLGLGYAHRMGIIHRDIKPSNIMVNRDGIAKVMDFGIAKVLGNRGLTRTGTQMGTSYYMSPEQVVNRGVDIRSDIYSLGVTLYEMLTGNVPFTGDTDFEVMQAHMQLPPPLPTRFYPYIPKGLENAVLKAMEKSQDARFQTVEEFGAALEHPEDFVPAQAPRAAAGAPLAGATRLEPLTQTIPPPPESPLPPPRTPPTGVPGKAAGAQAASAPRLHGRRKGLLIGAGVAAAVALTGIGLMLRAKPKPTPAPYISQSQYTPAPAPPQSQIEVPNPVPPAPADEKKQGDKQKTGTQPPGGKTSPKSEAKNEPAKNEPAPKQLVTPPVPTPAPAPEPPHGNSGGSNPPPPAPSPAPAPPVVNTTRASVPAQTKIVVRTAGMITTKSAKQGDKFAGSVDEAVMVGTQTVIPKGAEALIRVLKISESGKIAGIAQLDVDLASLTIAGKEYALTTDAFATQSGSRGKKSGVVIGTGAAIGGAIGGIFHKKNRGAGVAEGAAAGGAAGTAVQLASPGEAVTIAPETRITFTLQRPLDMAAQ
jgi:eukaryotic-like serine/threonine-protein kinase